MSYDQKPTKMRVVRSSRDAAPVQAPVASPAPPSSAASRTAPSTPANEGKTAPLTLLSVVLFLIGCVIGAAALSYVFLF